MRYLILSDLHANLQALDAVVAAATGRYDQALCCGDLIGYGADPNPVVEWVRGHCTQVVRGNHDKACTGLDDLSWFNPVARHAAIWTQKALTPQNIEYARNLPKGPLIVENFELVHGSPYDEDEYVLAAEEATQSFRLPGAAPDFLRPHARAGRVHLEPVAGGNDCPDFAARR